MCHCETGEMLCYMYVNSTSCIEYAVTSEELATLV